MEKEIADNINVAMFHVKYGTLMFATECTKDKTVSHDFDFQSAQGNKLNLLPW